MTTWRARLSGFFLCLIAMSAQASGLQFKSLDIDFADRADASTKARWLEPELSVSAAGLGWDGDDAASFREGWIETTPIAVGLSWRPGWSVSFRMQLEPELREITLNSGQKPAPYMGEVYARYSPDTSKHPIGYRY